MAGRLGLGHVVFELTEACNQNCRFCYNHWRPGGSRPVDSSLAKRTLNRILRQCEVGSISFSGGEPSLLGNMHDMALRCRFRGAAVNVLTNGTLISDDDIHILKDIGVNLLQIPLLSRNPVIHDYLTGVPGAWEKVLRTIRSVLETLGPEHIAAVLIVTARNADGLPGTLALYEELGVRTVLVNRFNLGGNGLKNRDELCMSRDALNHAFRIVSDFSVSHPHIDFISGVCTPACVLDPVLFPGIRFTSCSNDLKGRPLTISYRGDVRFCNHSPFVLGNVWERRLEDILSDESVMSRYSGVPDECISCRRFSCCKGGCRAAAEQVYGTFSMADPILKSL